MAEKEAVSPEEFFAYPLASAAMPEWAIAWLQNHHPDRKLPKLALECSHHALLKKAVACSDLISGAPRGAVQSEIDSGLLAEVNLTAARLENRAAAVSLRGRNLGPAGEILIRELETAAQE